MSHVNYLNEAPNQPTHLRLNHAWCSETCS